MRLDRIESDYWVGLVEWPSHRSKPLWRSFALNLWMSVIERPSVRLDSVGITFFASEFILLMCAQTFLTQDHLEIFLKCVRVRLIVELAPHVQQAGMAAPDEPTKLKMKLTWTAPRPL